MSAELFDLTAHFRALQIDGTPPGPKRGPKKHPGITVATAAERRDKARAPVKAARLTNIAVLDMETDPFDDEKREAIRPFVCEIYSDKFDAIVIWDENFKAFAGKVVAAIEALPDSFTIYAHNGGKFDFMFLVHLLRGAVKFKGRAIMSAKIGNHELRDSLHILPEKLAAWKKDKFDYEKMRKANRRRHRAEILTYLHADCVYLFDIVKRFVGEFGLKISIGQAAFAELRKHYKVEHLTETMDEALRPYFFGGRVECIAGRGFFDSATHRDGYKLYDVNSMYPWAMAHHPHPISTAYQWRRGKPGPDTVFIDLTCRNYGALVARGDDEGVQQGVPPVLNNVSSTNMATPDVSFGRFHTTIFEYDMARKYDLIDKVELHWCIDNPARTNFSKFIVPMYLRRIQTKAIMQSLRARGLENTVEFEETKKEDLLLKYLLNNSFGKFAQNPRNFKEYFYTAAGERPDAEWLEFLNVARDLVSRFEAGNARWQGAARDYETACEVLHRYSMPVERTPEFAIWAKPSPGRRYNNVGTAASITGAARAALLEAKVNAVDPIYCDTDSLICRTLNGVELDPQKLGAWDREEEFDHVIIAGKKLYCCTVKGRADGHEKRLKVRCKGADLMVRPKSPEAGSVEWRMANAATWKNYTDLLDDKTLLMTNKAPTMKKTGEQAYITRRIVATAPLRSRPVSTTARIIRHGA